MFCPSCKCEFRPGFDHCAACDRKLVATLEEAERAEPPKPPPPMPVRMGDFCGYADLREARQSRDQLAEKGLRCEITIRSAPESPPEGPVVEEFWLRVEAGGFAQAAAIVGFDAHDDSDGASLLSCPSCGAEVVPEEAFCAGCGHRFGNHA